MAATTSADNTSTAPMAEFRPAQTDSAPPQSVVAGNQFAPLTFGQPTIDPAGMSLAVLQPEKIKGGVRLTIALANTSDVPIMIDLGAMGPHDVRFNGALLAAMPTSSMRKRLDPGEGHTYECVFKLPGTAVGTLTLKLGSVIIAGRTAPG